MTPYELGSLIVAIVAAILSVAIPLAQFAYRKLSKPKLDLIPFDGLPLSLCFNESGSYAEFKFSILCENAGCLIRTIELTIINRNEGEELKRRWSCIKPIHTNWMSTGVQQALLNTATFVHPIKIEEGKAEPLNIEFGADPDDRQKVLLEDRDQVMLAQCLKATSLEEILSDVPTRELCDRVRETCFWKAGFYDAVLRVSYDAAGVCERRFSFELNGEDESRLTDNANGIATCRLPSSVKGIRPVIQPLQLAVKST